jgi:hypothetical protein
MDDDAHAVLAAVGKKRAREDEAATKLRAVLSRAGDPLSVAETKEALAAVTTLYSVEAVAEEARLRARATKAGLAVPPREPLTDYLEAVAHGAKEAPKVEEEEAAASTRAAALARRFASARFVHRQSWQTSRDVLVLKMLEFEKNRTEEEMAWNRQERKGFTIKLEDGTERSSRPAGRPVGSGHNQRAVLALEKAKAPASKRKRPTAKAKADASTTSQSQGA